MKQPARVIAPEDPDVKIPDAVRRSTARANAAFTTDSEGKPIEQPQEGQPPAEPQTPPAPPEPPPQPPAEQSPPSPPRQPAATPAPAPEVEDWEHRYNSMKGRWEQAAKTNKELSDEVTNLRRLIATLNTAPPPAQSNGSGTTPPRENQFQITPEEEQEFGPEFLDVVGRKAAQIAEERTRALREELDGVKQQLGQVGGSMHNEARAKMLQDFNDQLPNWNEINHSDGFKQWLLLPDTYSGIIRHELLKAAWARNDTRRAMAFFKGFLDEEAALAPARDQNTGRQPAQPPAQKPDLASFAAPGRAKAAAATAPADEKPIITRAQIQAFYRDVNSGKYVGRDAEKQRAEQQIWDAQNEGRISQ